ncbi:MAG: hypothetical protein ACRDYB_07665 [Acidimicrobiales bacterium]
MGGRAAGPVGTSGNSAITSSPPMTGLLGINFGTPPGPVSGAYSTQVDPGGPAVKAGITGGES